MDTFNEFISRSLSNAREAMRSVPLPWKQNNNPIIFRISVVTGDKRGAGTDANVYLTLQDSSGLSSKTLKPGCVLRNDHERGDTTVLNVRQDLGITPPITGIEIWRNRFGGISFGPTLNSIFFGDEKRDASDWFLDRVEVEFFAEENCPESRNNWIFPVHRWIEDGQKYYIPVYDSCLPQNDTTRKEFRSLELLRKTEHYVYARKVPNGPVQISTLPADEQFSTKFYMAFLGKKMSLIVGKNVASWMTCPRKNIDSLKDVFKHHFTPPRSVDYWREDWWFGLQRLQGSDSTILRLCQQLPQCFQDENLVLEFGKTLQEELQNEKLFICDLSILDGLSCEKDLAAPMALFHLNEKQELLPVAIRLRQCKEDNPIYTPKDDPNTWLVAKMFYNNAEAQHHQSISHLGLTHLLIEGVCAATHRCLSPSHPLFKLLAPHFLYLIAINKRGEEKLINPGGWVDRTMTQAVDGMMQLIGRGFQQWNFTKIIPSLEIAERGLLDRDILPSYPYRDDILEVYESIKIYVGTIVRHYYKDTNDLKNDWELSKWRQELCLEPPKGLGFKEMPGDSKRFRDVADLTEVVTAIISTCTLGHAAANAQQYDQYAFIPNYPGSLALDPPKEKIRYSDADLLKLLPSEDVLMDIIVITNLLSTPITKKLGDFEVQYLFHPEDVQALETFRSNLKRISEEITEKNQRRKIQYTDLNPENLPNSISV